MSARRRAVWVVPCALLLGSPAHADTTEPPRSRLYAGSSFSFINGSSLSIDGHEQRSEGGSLSLTFNAGYLQRLLPHVGAGLFASIGPNTTSWSDNRGEGRARADLALGPVFYETLKARRPNVEWRVGLPVGYTWAWFSPGAGRAVDETYSDGHGLNFSLVTGLDFFGERHGGFVDLAYVAHLTWITHTATLKAEPTIQSVQTYRFFDQSCFFGVGYAYRF